MRVSIVLVLCFISAFTQAQSRNFELMVHSSHDQVMAGDEVEYSFYIKNNSPDDITVPTSKSAARNIDDVLTHKFEVFDAQGEQINRQFRCSVGGSSGERRVMSGVLVKKGDSVLLTSKRVNFEDVGTYRGEYLFDFHPDNGSVPNQSPKYNKTIYLTSVFKIEVKALEANFTIQENRISAKDLENSPVFNSISEALKNPSAVFRIHLTNPTADELSMIHLFTNAQDVSLSGGTVDALPHNLFDLNLRKLVIRTKVVDGIVIPEAIAKSKELSYLQLEPSSSVDFTGMLNERFPELKTFILKQIYQPLELPLDLSNFPNLEVFIIQYTSNITSFPTDFSPCKNLISFQVKSESVEYGSELILPQINSLSLEGNSTNVLPKLDKCVKLETLNLMYFELSELPEHVLEIPNLKSLTIRSETVKNDVLKTLKKRGVTIIKT